MSWVLRFSFYLVRIVLTWASCSSIILSSALVEHMMYPLCEWGILICIQGDGSFVSISGSWTVFYFACQTGFPLCNAWWLQPSSPTPLPRILGLQTWATTPSFMNRFLLLFLSLYPFASQKHTQLKLRAADIPSACRGSRNSLVWLSCKEHMETGNTQDGVTFYALLV